jgi:hypothetical protein
MPEPTDAGLNEIAAALAALRPTAPALARDRLLFRAGRASAPRSWPWRLAAAASTTAAAVLAALLIFRPAPPPLVQTVNVPVAPQTPSVGDTAPLPPAPAEAESPPYPWPSTPYRRAENDLLRWGLDGLAPPPPASSPETRDSLLKSL